jgi:predicted ArsR family transcriptional regulator
MNHYGIEDCAGPLFAVPARAPAVQSSVTSMAAADAIGASLNALQRSVVSFLRTRGDHGATDEEIAVGLQMNPSTARPRRIELVRRGLVVEAGTRKAMSGRYATAWRLA